jgi:hypothetical protein
VLTPDFDKAHPLTFFFSNTQENSPADLQWLKGTKEASNRKTRSLSLKALALALVPWWGPRKEES